MARVISGSKMSAKSKSASDEAYVLVGNERSRAMIKMPNFEAHQRSGLEPTQNIRLIKNQESDENRFVVITEMQYCSNKL